MLAALALAFGQGCAAPWAVKQDAESYNKSLADIHSGQLLLNVLRASRKHPLYFTEVGSLTRTLTTTASTGSIDAPFGGGATSVFKVPLSLTATGGPTVSIGALNNDSKFMKGITTPVDAVTMRYFIDQGWPREVLLLLLVRQAVVERAGERIVFEGFLDLHKPDSKYRAYQRFIQWLAYGGYELKAKEIRQAVGPLLDRPEAANPDVLLLGTGEKLALEPIKVDGTGAPYKDQEKAPADAELRWQLQRVQVGWQLAKRQKESDARATSNGAVTPGAPFKPPGCELLDPQVLFGQPIADDLKADRVTVGGPDEARESKATAEGVKIYLYVRSPEAIIYHLGEIVRFQDEHRGNSALALAPTLCTFGGKPLFRASRGGSGESSTCCLSATYCGESFTVPSGADGGESMHVLSFLSQILALHKSSDSLPKSGVVTLVGGG